MIADAGYAICRDCGEKKKKLRAELKTERSYHYRDEFGRKWNGRQCWECTRRFYNEYDRKRGMVPRGMVLNSRYQKGYQSELIAKKYFESYGFSVTQTNGAGPDLVLFGRNNGIFTCEVKSVVKAKHNSYYLCKVTPARQYDDLLAYVLPCSTVIVETMREHLLKCPPCGVRSVSDMVIAFQNKRGAA